MVGWKNCGTSGHELGFPASEHLGDGIWELRVRVRKVRLRLLYFFVGRESAVVTHGFQKDTKKVPLVEINRAKSRRSSYRIDPAGHTFRWELDDE
ncbi:MAG: type II toxin-antitoxin system RelE/ParE family toxin [Pseudomonadota bacterium]